ncbi:MAG: hypothetical protein ABL984_06570 [Pyrinomonadaceae bacterium]
MNDLSCCNPHPLKRGITIGKWVAPGAALLLIPKCPLCIVAYFTALTGVGLSFSTAQYLRPFLIAVCFAGMAYVVVRTIQANIRTKYCVHHDKPL